MAVRIAIVPMSTILKHPLHDLRASAYIVNEHRLQQCEATARLRIKQGLTGLRKAAEERVAVQAFQAENGITEITVPRPDTRPKPLTPDSDAP